MARPRNPIMQFFSYSHLPEHLRDVSKPFSDLAYKIEDDIGTNSPELLACLRKLLEAKDCAVRAALFKENWA